MSAEDSIKVEVDDSEVDMLIAKLKMAMSLEASATSKAGVSNTRQLMNEWRQLERTWATMTAEPEVKSLYEKLPSINREMRILINQLPYGRDAQRVYFDLKRVTRGMEIGEIALYLSLIVTFILWAKRVERYLKNIERDKERYENYIRRERGLTKEEYDRYSMEAKNAFRSDPG